MRSAYYNLGAGDLAYLEMGKCVDLHCKAEDIAPFGLMSALDLDRHSHEVRTLLVLIVVTT
jgi:hypothetical protein